MECIRKHKFVRCNVHRNVMRKVGVEVKIQGYDTLVREEYFIQNSKCY